MWSTENNSNTLCYYFWYVFHWPTFLKLLLVWSVLKEHLGIAVDGLHHISSSYHINDSLLWHLQSVQNAAARLVTGIRRSEHITPALRQLHWLPVWQRIQYKLASLAFRALSGLAPDYLAGDCQLVADSRRRSLRSAERRVCTVPRQNSTFGDRSFAAAGPRATSHGTSCRSVYVTLGYRLLPSMHT